MYGQFKLFKNSIAWVVSKSQNGNGVVYSLLRGTSVEKFFMYQWFLGYMIYGIWYIRYIIYRISLYQENDFNVENIIIKKINEIVVE